MLTALDFWHLVEHIIPVYVIVFVGYVLVRYKVIQGVHAPGINRWVSIMGVPAYVFHLLAFNDPYQISLRLVGADVVQKMVALILGCLWWKFSKKGKIDHLISFYMLATLPNTVLIGDALLQPLYGAAIHGNVVTIIFLQALLWYNLAIALYELRTVLLNLQAKKVAAGVQLQPGKLGMSSRKSPSISIVIDGNGTGFAADEHELDMNNSPGHQLVHVSPSPMITRTLSAPARMYISKVVPFTAEPTVSEENEDPTTENFSRNPESDVEFQGTGMVAMMDEEENEKLSEFQGVGMVAVMDEAEQEKPSELKDPHKFVYVGMVVGKVINRLKYAPLTYASIIGFVYSLFAFKFHWTMPYSIRTSVELISEGAVGMAIFILGMQWANSGKLISCGWRKMVYGMFVRFLFGPIIMIITSLVLGLRGNNFRFAVLQAVIPQGVISFVLAKEYNLDADEFSTAVIFQLIIFLPVIIAYYYILSAV